MLATALANATKRRAHVLRLAALRTARDAILREHNLHEEYERYVQMAAFIVNMLPPGENMELWERVVEPALCRTYLAILEDEDLMAVEEYRDMVYDMHARAQEKQNAISQDS